MEAPVKDIFTMEQLPPGKMMVVGRTMGGKEIACVLGPNHKELYLKIIENLQKHIMETF